MIKHKPNCPQHYLFVRWISLVCSRLSCVSLSLLRALFRCERDWVLLLRGPRDSAAVFFSPLSCSSAIDAHQGLYPVASGTSRSCRREALECTHVDEGHHAVGVLQEVRNPPKLSAPTASPTTGRRVPASAPPLGRRHAQVSRAREYLVPHVAARDLRSTSIREDDTYNTASTGDLASDHGPLPPPQEATARPSPSEMRGIYAKTTTHRRRKRPCCTCPKKHWRA